MSDKYILNENREAVRCDDLMKWARLFENDANRRVGSTEVGPYHISTVFIGLDHSLGRGPPQLFETMVFGLEGDGEDMDRCSTWAEAEAMHAEFVRRYTAKLS